MELLEQKLTARQAADHAGVRLITIYSWQRRGHLKPAGLDPNGVYLYNLLDVAKAEYATRKRAGRSYPNAA